jgi:thiamine transport system permease protein
MAERLGEMKLHHPAARATLALIALALAAGFLPVLWLGINSDGKLFDAYTIRVLIFTIVQALLSTLFSIMLGLPAALALARRNFPGRDILISLLALPMALPQIVVVLGLIGLFGKQGWLADTIPLYGLTGILLAHVFFNATLVARLCLTTLQSIPTEHFRLAAQLGLKDSQHFKLVDWPALRLTLPGTALLVFLLCAASFTIVLTLGGGPQATTLEAAIYQALRFDFDPARATALTVLQLVLCIVLGVASLAFTREKAEGMILRVQTRRFDGQSLAALTQDIVSVALLVLLLLLPLAALVTKGIGAIAFSETLLRALLTSATLATATALTTCAAALALTSAAARSTVFARAGQWASIAGLALPPAVIATGWFMLAISSTGLAPVAPMLIILLNTLLALPYAYRTLLPSETRIAQQDRLAESLNIKGWNRLRIDTMALQPALTTAFAMSFVLSLGDLAAVLFFGDGQYVTLPALIYQQMGSYRMEGAIGTALVLAILSWAILFTAEKAGRNA